MATVIKPKSTGPGLKVTPKPPTQPAEPQPQPPQPAPSHEQTQAEAEITAAQLWPVKAVWRGMMAINTRSPHYTGIVRVAGTNASLMSTAEKHGQIRRLASLFDSTTNPSAWYCVSKPRSLKSYIRRLDAKRLSLGQNDQKLREQFWITRDHLTQKQKERAITQRLYYSTFEASGSDLKALNGATGDEDEARPNLFKTVLDRLMIYGLGRDPQGVAASRSKTAANSAPKKAKRRRPGDNVLEDSPHVPAGLLDTLSFKLQSYADQLTLNGMPAQPLNDQQIARMLIEQFNAELHPAEEAELTREEEEAHAGTTNLKLDPTILLGRADFEERPSYLKLGNDFISSLVVTEYPRNFRAAQLFPIIRFRDIRLSLAVHFQPLTVKEAESKLRSRQQILWAVEAESKSAAGNMDRAYKIESIKQLRTVLASGDARIFKVMIVASVRATSRRQMREDLQKVAQRLIESNFGVMYPTRNQRRAWLSSIPLGHNFLAGEKLITDRISHPNMTGIHLATLLPNCVADFTMDGGNILGRNKEDGSLIAYNRWHRSLANPHSIGIGTTGAGKSLNQEHELMGEFERNPDLEAHMIDIQNVLEPFCKQVGGIMIDLSLAGKNCINPMDRYVCLGRPETVGERLSFLYALFTLMIKSELAPAERNAIGHALKRLYHHFENGESSLATVYANFANNPLYAPLRPYLTDYRQTDQMGQEHGELQPGLLTRLREIYDFLADKHKIPPIGLVEGRTDPATGLYQRPICRLHQGRWYYCGEGMTADPYIEPQEIKDIAPGKSRPAGVFYPHPDWLGPLMDEYETLVEESGLFDALDETAREPAIRDAAIELKRGQPILGDFLPYVMAEGAVNLAANLEQYTDEEMFGPVFNHYTNINLDSRFISWNCKDLDEGTLRPIRMFQVVNLVWARVRAYRKRRIFIADEFQTLVQNYTDVANFIRDLFQRGRFFRLSMVALVQNITAFLDYPQALVCCQNAERIILMKQNKLAVDRLQAKFELTDGEVDALLKAKPGGALMKVGNSPFISLQYEIPTQHLKAWDTNTDQASHEDDEDVFGDYSAQTDDEDDEDDED